MHHYFTWLQHISPRAALNIQNICFFDLCKTACHSEQRVKQRYTKVPSPPDHSRSRSHTTNCDPPLMSDQKRFEVHRRYIIQNCVIFLLCGRSDVMALNDMVLWYPLVTSFPVDFCVASPLVKTWLC